VSEGEGADLIVISGGWYGGFEDASNIENLLANATAFE
jgi:hypothetical protein